MGHSGIPSPSTITSILRRNERISSAKSLRHKPWKRFEAQRPHQCLNMNVPSKCYRISERKYPEEFKEIEYSPSDLVRKIQFGGIVYFRNREFKVGKAFTGQRVALRETDKDGKYNVYFCNQKISKISLI